MDRDHMIGNTVHLGGNFGGNTHTLGSANPTGQVTGAWGKEKTAMKAKTPQLTTEQKRMREKRAKQQQDKRKRLNKAAAQLATLEISTHDKRVWAFQFTNAAQERVWINRLKRAAGLYHQRHLRHRNAPPKPTEEQHNLPE